MDVHDKLDELTALVEEARSMPMSASCIVNRGDVLALLDDVRELLPEEFRHAELLLQDREAVVDEGRREAATVLADAQAEVERLLAQAHDDAERVTLQAREQADELVSQARAEHARLLDEARAEHARLVDETGIVASAQRQADELLAATRAETARMQREIDEYVDARLASIEGVLTRTLAEVQRGRDRMQDRATSEEAPPQPYDERQDAYDGGAQSPYDAAQDAAYGGPEAPYDSPQAAGPADAPARR